MHRHLPFLSLRCVVLAALTACSAIRPSGKFVSRTWRDEKPQSRMEAASPGEFPFFVQWGGCAATLIWEDILLTSASCDVLETDDVLVGAYFSMKQSNDTERMRIIERRQHPEFNSTTFSNNFMVLKLDQAVDTLPRVILQEYDEIPEGSKLAVVGFGSTAARIEISKIDSEVFQHNVIDTSEILRYGNDDGPVIHMNDAILQKEEVALVPFEECNADDQFAGFIDNNTMICAGNLDDGGDICFGDSGGPLCVMENGNCTQIGIVSFGTTCAIRDRAAVYSRVSAVYDWIQERICELSSSPPIECPSPSPTQKPTPSSSPSLEEPGNSYLQPSIVSIEEIAGRRNSDFPSDTPSMAPSDLPSSFPSVIPTATSSLEPSEFELSAPISSETTAPSSSELIFRSDEPSVFPSIEPSVDIYDSATESDTESDVTSSPSAVPISLPTPRSKRSSPPPHRTNVRTEDVAPRIPISSAEPFQAPTNVPSDSPSISQPPTMQRLFKLTEEETNHNTRAILSSDHPKDSGVAVTSSSLDFPSVAPSTNPFSVTDKSVTFSLTKHMSTKEDDEAPVTRRNLQESKNEEDNFQSLRYPTMPPEDKSINIANEYMISRTEATQVLSSSPWTSADGLLPNGLHLFYWVENPPNKILGPCEGDCDTDADCANGLYCFSKPDGVAMEVPGCIGVDSSDTDFCTFKNLNLGVNPIAKPDGINLFTWKQNPPNQKLGPCEGDCDVDEDCLPGLYCFPKALGQKIDVPGCKGVDTSNTDFCVWKPTPQPTPLPTIKPTKPPTPMPTPSPPTKRPSSTSPPTKYPILFVFPENPPLAKDRPLQLCQGDCDDDSDCAEGLICYMRKESETTIPWCTGITTSKTEFCTYPEGSRPPTSKPTLAPTPAPTPSPTRLPTVRPTPPPPTPRPNQGPKTGPTTAPTNPPKTLAPTPQPTPSPTGLQTSVTLAIYFDPWPEETSWTIENLQKDVISSVPPGTYVPPMDQVRETITVNEGATYVLTIGDSAGDGIAGIGNLFVLSMTDRPDIVLAQGDGVFAEQHIEMFYVPTPEEYPSSAPTMTPAPTFKTIGIFLTINFDSWHQETAWQVVAQENPNQIWAEAVYDTYRAGESVTENILLPTGRPYIFIIKDFFQDGIDGGSYKMVTANGRVLFEGDGNFGAERRHQFAI